MPILLATLGLLLIFYLGKLILRNLIGNPLRWIEKQKLKKKIQFLYRADALIQANDHQSAVALLRNAFCLDHFRSDFSILDKLNNHHLSILSRALTIAEKPRTRLDSLAVLEDLLATRIQLQKAYLEKSMVKRGVTAKTSGRANPAWATAEFENQLSELRDRLGTNRKSLESQLSKLFHELAMVKAHEEITYH